MLDRAAGTAGPSLSRRLTAINFKRSAHHMQRSSRLMGQLSVKDLAPHGDMYTSNVPPPRSRLLTLPARASLTRR